jgi:hypothetical protein
MTPTLTEQLIAGAYARDVLRDAENMMQRIAQWDLMFEEEKAREFEKGAFSPFFEVPGFEPRWCESCQDETHFDFREDPEGACGKCGAWDGQSTKEAA